MKIIYGKIQGVNSIKTTYGEETKGKEGRSPQNEWGSVSEMWHGDGGAVCLQALRTACLDERDKDPI